MRINARTKTNTFREITEYCQDYARYQWNIGEGQPVILGSAVEGSYKIAKWHKHKHKTANGDFSQEQFIVHEEIAAEENIANTPQYGTAEKPGEKPLSPLPRAVGNEDSK